jgi:ornithine cyclodeaminase
VLVWNRTAGRAETVAAALRAEGVAAEATADLPAAVRQSQLISSATRTHTPLIEGAWLARGAHLDLVGGYTPDTREADDEAARRSRVFVDCRESAFDGVGDILGPIASGAITQDDVRGDLYDLIGGGVPGRTGPDDTTFFKNAGGGHLDLMTAQAIMAALDNGP